MSRIARGLSHLSGVSKGTPFAADDHPWGKNLLREDPHRADKGDVQRSGPSAVDEILGHARRRPDAVRLVPPPAIEHGRSALECFSPATIVQLSSLIDKVFLTAPGDPPRSVAFSSVDRAAVSGPVVAAVAELLAQQTTASVGVLDATLSARSLHKCFGIAPTPDLADAMAAGLSLATLAQPVRDNLSVLCAGCESGYITAASESSRIQLAQFFAAFDYVLVDIEPVLPRGAASLAALVDGVILVMAAESTRREAGRRAIELLRSGGAYVIGAVLTECRFPISDRIHRRL